MKSFNLIKKFFICFLAFLILGQAFTFATPAEIFSNYGFYTGSVYLMNDENNSVIFRNVKRDDTIAKEFAIELEFTELDIISDNIYSKNGEKLSFETINTYLLDSQVTFIAAKTSDRIRIIYIEFTD